MPLFPRKLPPFFRYCIVGGMGTAIDLGVVFLGVTFFGMHPVLASFFGFLFAVIHNFMWNKIWTFHNASTKIRKLFTKFLLVSLVGLALTIFLMTIFVPIFASHYLWAKAFTSGVVLMWNFIANKLWTFRLDSRKIHLPKNFTKDLSIVIPAFNEEKRLQKTLNEMRTFFQKHAFSVEWIVVNDGSSDGTKELVKKMQFHFPHLWLYSFSKNRGKGAACARGVEKSNGRWILIADADNSTPISEFLKLKKEISHHEVAIGSRFLPDKTTKRQQSRWRVGIGRIGNFFIRLILIDGIRDTQCGFKLFQHKAAKEIFFRQKIHRFGFDIEALLVARALSYSVKEVPVSWFYNAESRVRPIRDAIRTFFDLLYIKINWWIGRYE